MTNPAYTATGNPANVSRGVSALIRAEFLEIQEAFDLIYANGSGFQLGIEAQGATANDYVVTLSPAPTAYTTPTGLTFKATHTNTGAAQVRIGALAYVPIVNVDGSAVSASDITSGALVSLMYDGTSFFLMSGNDRANKNGEAYAGSHDFTAALPTVATGVPFAGGSAAASQQHVSDMVNTSLLGATGTSATSQTIGLGRQTLVTQTGKAFYAGQAIRRFYDETNYEDGIVVSYDSTTGAMVFASQTVVGSGTYSAWSLGPVPVYADDAITSAFYFANA